MLVDVYGKYMQVLDKPNQQTELGPHQQIRGVFPAGHVWFPVNPSITINHC